MELDHKRYYFDDKGALVKNKQFPIIEKGLWKSMPYVFYSDHDGVADYLNKKLNIVTYPFPIYYTLPSENNREYPKNQFMMDYEGRWYYFNKDGFPVTGPKTIDGFELYFHESSLQKDIKLKVNLLILIIKSTTLTKTMVVKSRTLPLS